MDVEALARESHVNPFRTGCKASLQVRNLFMDNVRGGGASQKWRCLQGCRLVAAAIRRASLNTECFK